MSQLAARLTQPTEQLRTLLQRPITSDTLVSQTAGGTPISTTKVWVPGTDTVLTLTRVKGTIFILKLLLCAWCVVALLVRVHNNVT